MGWSGGLVRWEKVEWRAECVESVEKGMKWKDVWLGGGGGRQLEWSVNLC